MFKDKFYDKIDGVAMGYILKFYIRRVDCLIYYILRILVPANVLECIIVVRSRVQHNQFILIELKNQDTQIS